MEGVVLETYGSGNAPDNRPDLLEELKKATDAGIIIINCTQCLKGTVSPSYATGQVGPEPRLHFMIFLEELIKPLHLWCLSGVD